MIAKLLQLVTVVLAVLACRSEMLAETTGSVSVQPFVNFVPNTTDFQPGDQISVSATATASVPATDEAAEVFFDIEIVSTNSKTSTFKTIQPGTMADFDALGVSYNVPTQDYSVDYWAYVRLWYVDDDLGVTDIAYDFEHFDTD